MAVNGMIFRAGRSDLQGDSMATAGDYSYDELASATPIHFPFDFTMPDDFAPPEMAPNWQDIKAFDINNTFSETGSINKNPFVEPWGINNSIEDQSLMTRRVREETPVERPKRLNDPPPGPRSLKLNSVAVKKLMHELEQLEQKERLWENRQAALDSRQRRKARVEALESEATDSTFSNFHDLRQEREEVIELFHRKETQLTYEDPFQFIIPMQHPADLAFGNEYSGFRLSPKFQRASQEAYNKLKNTYLRSWTQRTPLDDQLSIFLIRLGSHDEIVERGFKVFKNLLNHEAFSDLLDVYSFLHVAYAISQVESRAPCHSTPADFNAGLAAFRNCLDPKPVDPNDFESYCELDVFDQIVEIMWKEIDEAMGWLGRQEGLDFLETLKKTANKLEEARRLLVRARRIESLSMTAAYEFDDDGGGKLLRSDSSSQWLDIVTGSIFGIVIGFMRAVANTTSELLEAFASTAYSFLLHPIENASEGLQHYFSIFFDNMYNTSEDEVQKTCPSDVFQTALEMLRDGTIPTLRHFENYILWIGKVASRHQSQFVTWAECMLRQCGSCAYHVSDKDQKKVKPDRAEEYGIDYLTKRFDEAVAEYQEMTPHPDVSMVDQDVSHLEESSPLLSNDESIQSAPDLSHEGATPTTSTSSFDEHLNSASDSQSQEGTVVEPKGKIIITCNIEQCNKTFSTRPNLFRHQRSAHPDIAVGTSTDFVCGYEGCTVTLNRKDNIHRHRAKVHGIKKKQPVYRA